MSELEQKRTKLMLQIAIDELSENGECAEKAGFVTCGDFGDECDYCWLMALEKKAKEELG